MLLSAGVATSALQGSVFQAASEQLRVTGRGMAALHQRKIAAAHLDRSLAPVLCEVAGGCTGFCMEERRMQCCFAADASLECKEKPAVSFTSFSFDSTTGVAVVELAPVDIEADLAS